ncbi:hypothetical protein GCM10010448_70880 [Streptomyces glomeratus]|uniref:Transposase DDE domain-containing protein n=1 Tax=Streptomyces glomeratus TaxID=284452 RepID=A0ABP6M562_9ACTN
MRWVRYVNAPPTATPTIEITGVHRSPATADYYQYLPIDRYRSCETGVYAQIPSRSKTHFRYTPYFTAVMEQIRVPRIGPGRPRVRPANVLGDKGYSSRAIRTWLRRRGIRHPIPERADQVRNRLRRGSRRGRPPVFDKQLYKRRNVERCFNRLKQWRGIATRYDKTAESYQAAVTLASLLMWV